MSSSIGSCAVCLGEIEDEAFLDTCLHHFCFEVSENRCLYRAVDSTWSDLASKLPRAVNAAAVRPPVDSRATKS